MPTPSSSQVAYYLPNALDVSSIYCPDAPTPEPEPPSPAPPLDERSAPGGWCALFDASGCIRDESTDHHRSVHAYRFNLSSFLKAMWQHWQHTRFQNSSCLRASSLVISWLAANPCAVLGRSMRCVCCSPNYYT